MKNLNRFFLILLSCLIVGCSGQKDNTSISEKTSIIQKEIDSSVELKKDMRESKITVSDQESSSGQDSSAEKDLESSVSEKELFEMFGDSQKEDQEKTLIISQNEEFANYLCLGDLWQSSSAYDVQASQDLFQFIKFYGNGSVNMTKFNGEEYSGSYQIDNTDVNNLGGYQAQFLIQNDNTQLSLSGTFWLSPGKNLDQNAPTDYSSLVMDFNRENNIQENSILFTTSGLSLDEANQITALAAETSAALSQSRLKEMQIPTNKSETVQLCWDFFINKGLSKEQTAGILGNIQQESDFNYLSQSSSGTYFGLFQMGGQRQAGMLELGGAESALAQLEYVWQENFTSDSPYSSLNYYALQNNTFGSDPRGGCIHFLEKGHSVEDYAISFMMNVERCYTDQTGWQQADKRVAYALYYYDLLS